uniref:Zinc finger BED domain-containing protein 5 n=1 Tax=Steinernema glaseri TaxID=37863 RepID=A0A1I8AJJ3_9BILA
MQALYEEYKERKRNRMSSVKYISFTTDSWSSETNDHSFLSLTAHWIDNGAVYGGLKKLIGNQAVFNDLVERIKTFIRKIRKSIDKEAFKALQEFDGLEHRWLIRVCISM